VWSKAEPRVRACHSHSVASHLRTDAAAGDLRHAGAGRPGRDRSTMSDNGRALQAADRLTA